MYQAFSIEELDVRINGIAFCSEGKRKGYVVYYSCNRGSGKYVYWIPESKDARDWYEGLETYGWDIYNKKDFGLYLLYEINRIFKDWPDVLDYLNENNEIWFNTICRA